MRDECRVDPGSKSKLTKRETSATFGFEKDTGEAELAKVQERLSRMQNRLYAEHRRAVVLVLQGLDASGKDGTVKRVFTGLNPQGCLVHSFKAPVGVELEHDYLWRVHNVMPPHGIIGIFNRSHYEDIVTAHVIGVINADESKRRREQVNEFERSLHDEGTTLVKVFLHVGRDEQKERLQARLDDPEKRWKFRKEDLDVRAQWDTYMELYEATLTDTSTDWAPWYIVPADRKWAAGLAVAKILLSTLDDLDPQIPPNKEDLSGIVIE